MNIFLKFILPFVILSLFFSSLTAQQASDCHLEAVANATNITDTATKNIGSLAKALTKNLTGDDAKACAIYNWVAHNIRYDYLGVDNVTLGFNSEDVVQEALDRRKGVCQHFAELFDTLARHAGLTSTIIFGYTKQNGKIAKVPHAWNAVKIDSSWYLYDPTWGAGYFTGSKYHQHYSLDYYKITPDKMIASHMPFDPLFQFMEYPVSRYDFEKGKRRDSSYYINYKTEIQRYLSMSEADQLPEAMLRVQQFGINNTMVRGYYSNLNRRNKVYLANQEVDKHNRATALLNELVAEYNNYVDDMNARAGRFPDDTRQTEAKLRDMEGKAVRAKALFDEVNPPMRLAETLANNEENLDKLLTQIRTEQDRLKRHQKQIR